MKIDENVHQCIAIFLFHFPSRPAVCSIAAESQTAKVYLHTMGKEGVKVEQNILPVNARLTSRAASSNLRHSAL